MDSKIVTQVRGMDYEISLMSKGLLGNLLRVKIIGLTQYIQLKGYSNAYIFFHVRRATIYSFELRVGLWCWSLELKGGATKYFI